MSFGNLLPDSAHSAHRNGSLFEVVKVWRKKRLFLQKTQFCKHRNNSDLVQESWFSGSLSTKATCLTGWRPRCTSLSRCMKTTRPARTKRRWRRRLSRIFGTRCKWRWIKIDDHPNNNNDLIPLQMKCCGVVNADDWRNNVTNPGWTDSKNKPEGCCKWKKDDNVSCYLTF